MGLRRPFSTLKVSIEGDIAFSATNELLCKQRKTSILKQLGHQHIP